MIKSILLKAWKTPVKRRKLYAGIGAIGAGLSTYYYFNKQNENVKLFAHAREVYESCKGEFDSYLSKQLLSLPYYIKERENDWKEVGEKEGCKISTLQVPFSDFYVIKGSTVVNTGKSVKDILELFSDVVVNQKKRKTYKRVSPNNIYLRVLKSNGHRYLTHGRWTTDSWVIQDRDVVMLAESKLLEGDECGYIYGGSVDQDVNKKQQLSTTEPPKSLSSSYSSYPSDDECVRGDIKLFFWRVVRINPERVLVEYISHTDPRGFIPVFLYNMVAAKQALSCLKMVEVMLGKENIIKS